MKDSEFNLKHREILIETFRVLINYIENHHLNYFVAYGTALGTVRHKGMIPWDDDIDIYMPRKDYNRLFSIWERNKDLRYDLVDYNDDRYYLPMGKFYDKSTTLQEFKHFKKVIGIYIDIFPLDFFDEKQTLHKISKEAQLKFDTFQFSKVYSQIDYLDYLIKGKHLKTIIKYPIGLLRNMFVNQESAINDYKAFIDGLGEKMDGNYCTFLNYKDVFPAKWFTEYTEMKFETFYVRITKYYHDYLTLLYGDYMTPPPVDKQVSNGDHNRYYINLSEKLNFNEVKERVLGGERCKI